MHVADTSLSRACPTVLSYLVGGLGEDIVTCVSGIYLTLGIG